MTSMIFRSGEIDKGKAKICNYNILVRVKDPRICQDEGFEGFKLHWKTGNFTATVKGDRRLAWAIWASEEMIWGCGLI